MRRSLWWRGTRGEALGGGGIWEDGVEVKPGVVKAWRR